MGLTYKDAGVDIEAGDALVERIKPLAARTLRPEVVSGVGGFGGLFALPPGKYHEPVLVSGTDGVGTKLKIALAANKHDTVGIDLVAMSVNDVLTSGAEPLFFLDYLATGRLDVDQAAQVVAGIAEGCARAGCTLLGGETAEHPGSHGNEYDLAGFCVGVVEKSRRVDGRSIRAGDRLLGLASSGFHSNGYSLVRRVFLDHMRLPLGAAPPGFDEPLAQLLLRPTRIYVRALRALHDADLLRGAAHITGGGLIDNPPRMLPSDARLRLRIQLGSWDVPPIFGLLARGGDVAEDEMLRTFNMGIGMVVCVPADGAAEATAVLTRAGEQVFPIGEVVEADAPDQPVELVR